MKRVVLLLTFLVSLCAQASVLRVERADVSLFSKQGTHYVICGKLDFAGQTIRLPQGCTVSFDEGRICRATLVGNDTWIDAGLEKIFDHVQLEGSFRNAYFEVRWFVEKVSSGLNGLVPCTAELQAAFDSGAPALHFTPSLYYVPATVRVNKRVLITGNMAPLSCISAEASSDKQIPYGLYTDKGNTILQIDFGKAYPYSNTYSISGITCISDYSKAKPASDKPLIAVRMCQIWGFDFDASLCSLEYKAPDGYRTKHGVGLRLFCATEADYGSFLQLGGSISGFRECLQIDAGKGWINDVRHHGSLVGVVGIRVSGDSSPLVLDGQYQPSGGYAKKDNGEAFIYQDQSVVFNSIVWDLGIAPSKYVGATCQYALCHNGSGEVINHSTVVYYSFAANNTVYNPDQSILNSSVFAVPGNMPDKVQTRLFYKSTGKNIRHELHNEQMLFGALRSINTKECAYIVLEDAVPSAKLDDVALELVIKGSQEIFTYGANYFHLAALRADKSFFNGFKYANVKITGALGLDVLFETGDMLLYNNETNINHFVYRIQDTSYLPGHYTIRVGFSGMKTTAPIVYLLPLGISNERAIALQ